MGRNPAQLPPVDKDLLIVRLNIALAKSEAHRAELAAAVERMLRLTEELKRVVERTRP